MKYKPGFLKKNHWKKDTNQVKGLDLQVAR